MGRLDFEVIKEKITRKSKRANTASEKPARDAVELTLMSYNTQHCLNYRTRKIDYQMVADTIKKCGADIVGLQEIRNKSDAEGYDAQAKIIAHKLGFYYYFAEAIRFSGKNPYGNALLSRYPIISAETILIPDPKFKIYPGYYETRCILKAKIDVKGAILNVLVTHLGLNPNEHRKGVRTILSNLEKKNCVLIGDFNMKPHNKKLRPIKERLYDTAEKFSAPKLSFPSDNPKHKIDYIFTSRDLKILSADIPPIVSSDHRPHIATLEF